MPEYFCKCCNYTTTRKSNYDTHNKSKTHLKNAETTNDDVSELSTDTSITHISFLQNELKQYKEEIQSLRNQLEQSKLETIKYQTESKMKDEIIIMLKQTPQPVVSTPKEDDNNSIEQKSSTKEKLKKERPNAKTIDDIIVLFKDAELNDLIEYANFPDGEKPIFNTIDMNNFEETDIQHYVKTITNTISKIPMNERPFYCSDKSRNIFWINKKEEGWIKCDKQYIDSIILDLIKKFSHFNLRTIYNTRVFAEKYKKAFYNKYKVQGEDWLSSEGKYQSLVQILMMPTEEEGQKPYEKRDTTIKHIRCELMKL